MTHKGGHPTRGSSQTSTSISSSSTCQLSSPTDAKRARLKARRDLSPNVRKRRAAVGASHGGGDEDEARLEEVELEEVEDQEEPEDQQDQVRARSKPGYRPATPSRPTHKKTSSATTQRKRKRDLRQDEQPQEDVDEDEDHEASLSPSMARGNSTPTSKVQENPAAQQHSGLGGSSSSGQDEAGQSQRQRASSGRAPPRRKTPEELDTMIAGLQHLLKGEMMVMRRLCQFFHDIGAHHEAKASEDQLQRRLHDAEIAEREQRAAEGLPDQTFLQMLFFPNEPT